MNHRRWIYLSFVLALLLGGCGGMKTYLAGTTSTVEMYHIFDIKTPAPSTAVTTAANAGLGKNATDVQTGTPAQASAEVPAEPGRFKIAKLDNAALKSANCDGALWAARAQKAGVGTDNIALYGCLYKYQAGYQLDTFATFVKAEGGWLTLPRYVRSKWRGTPEGWADKAVLDMVHEIEAASGVRATHLEGQPQLPGSPAVASTGQ